ncbi:hypothetical protein LguiB_026962 [Lonicera macranthoides]
MNGGGGSIYSCQNTWRARKEIAARTLGTYREAFPPLDHPDFWICVETISLLDRVKISSRSEFGKVDQNSIRPSDRADFRDSCGGRKMRCSQLNIAKMEFDFRGTSVICRSGSPLILADLKKVSVSKARAIIVLAEDGNADQSDARALRTVLSLTGVKEGLRGHIVVELSDLDNEILVKLVGGDLVETVVAHDVIGRLMIQYARQPGLTQAWSGNLPKDSIVPKSDERILFCGWRQDMEDMVMVLDAFLALGSKLWMFKEVPEKEREKKLIDGGLDINCLVNITLVLREGNVVIRCHLESIPLESFDLASDENLRFLGLQAKLLPYRETALGSQGQRGDRQINNVLEELFAEEGNEMHIRQAELYLIEGE